MAKPSDRARYKKILLYIKRIEDKSMSVKNIEDIGKA